jgi:hypothetical protein
LRANNDEVLFDGLCDTSIVLEQQSELPWIRAVSNPIHTLSAAGTRNDQIPVEKLMIEVDSDQASIGVAIDLVKPSSCETEMHSPARVMRCVGWHDIAVRIAMEAKPAQMATLGWFHEY